MKIYWQTLILLSLVSCSKETDEYIGGYPARLTEREQTEIVCPVHQVAVFKVHASGEISCPVWDPKLGLTIEQIRNRFPYAIWDSNLHHVDDSSNAQFPMYNLVCDRCVASWREYVEAHPFPKENRFVISITESEKILINETEFSIDQIAAVAKAVSNHHANPRLHIRAHNTTNTDIIKSVVDACAEGGLTDVIFGSYAADPESGPQQAANKPE